MQIKKNLEEQKQSLKGKMSAEIDKYFDQFQQQERKINIDTIERIMIESKAKMHELINEATSDIVETSQAGIKKKSVPNVGKQ